MSRKSHKNPYNEDILRQSYRPNLKKKFKRQLERALPPIILRIDIKRNTSDYAEFLTLKWDYEHGFLPTHKLREFNDLIEKYKIKEERVL